MKSFSSFSFNDIPIDKNLNELPTDLGSISYRFSDPCLLDSNDGDVTKNAIEDEDFVFQRSSFRSSESSVLEIGNRHRHKIAHVHTKSIDSWLTDHFEEENGKKMKKALKQRTELLQRDSSGSEEKKKEKQLVNKKQVSIVEDKEQDEQSARKKREKFKRQDTPLNPQSTSQGSKQLSIPRSLTINVTSNKNQPLPHIRTVSYDERSKASAPCLLSHATRHKKTQNLTSSPKKSPNGPKLEATPSFLCSVELAESNSTTSLDKVSSPKDEFAQFVKASIHPPNELSVPRCYQDPNSNTSPRRISGSAPHSPYSRSQSMDPGQKYKSHSSLSPKYHRPKLKRETAQDFEDGDVHPGIDLGDFEQKGPKKHTLSPNMLLKPGQKHLVHQKSAPGTPLSPKRFAKCYKTPSRTPSDESSSGYLNVPKARLRGSSLSGDLDSSLSQNNLYLLRQFNIQGKKVIHVGDSLQHRAVSSNSINSAISRSSSVCRQASGKSSLDNNFSVEEEVGSLRSGYSREDQLSLDDDQNVALLAREGLHGQSIEYTPVREVYRVTLLGAPGVGKSSLCHKFLSPDYVYTYESSQGGHLSEPSVCIMLEDVETELVFRDGLEKQIQSDETIPTCDCVVVTFSVTDSSSLKAAETILQKLWQTGDLNTKAVIVVGNKADLVRTRVVPILEGRSLAISHDCKYVEVSAALDHNVDTLLVGIVKQIRLKMQMEKPRTHYARRKSAQVRMKGLIEKVLGHENKSKSCENLNVI